LQGILILKKARVNNKEKENKIKRTENLALKVVLARDSAVSTKNLNN
jgi:hypothetical protein